MGHFFQMLEGNPGVVLRSWTNTLPKSNLIRYLDFANLERVAPITPAALADILVHKCYDFEKPAELRKGISRILGLGLFLAEGEVHKVNKSIAQSVSSELIALLEATQAVDACLRIQTCPKPLSDVLGQVEGIDGCDHCF